MNDLPSPGNTLQKASAPKVKDPQKTERSLLSLFEYAEVVVVCLLAIFAVYAFGFRICSVAGDSMNYTLKNQQKLLVSGIFYEPEQGDIVVFHQISPNHPQYNEPIIKRVIATPGDYIWIESDGTVFLNGEALDEPYITEKALGECDIEFPYQVPENAFFMMGDQRETSIDSRSSVIGCISDDQILGRLLCRIWPLSQFEWMN